MEVNAILFILGLLGNGSVFLVLAGLLGRLLLLLVLLLGLRLLEVQVDDDHGSGLDFPQLALVVLGKGEALDEGNPVLDGDAYELSQVGVHDVLKAVDDALERRGFIVSTISFEEVVVSSKLVLDLTNEEVTPLNQHVLGHRLMVGVLDLVNVSQLSWELKDGLVGVEVPELEEVNAFLGEYLGHANQVSIRAPVLLDDFI
jgi:hypothetical protein